MTDSAQSSVLLDRAIYCPNGYYYSNGRCEQYSSWYYWGRWVFAAIIILCLIALIILWGRMNSRKRRRRGENPFYGTGWMAPAHKYGTYDHNMQTYQPPPPQYSATPMGNQYTGQTGQTGHTFNSNEGYYGHHQEGVQAPQAPQNAYHPQQRNAETDYAPPPGPPPGK